MTLPRGPRLAPGPEEPPASPWRVRREHVAARAHGFLANSGLLSEAVARATLAAARLPAPPERRLERLLTAARRARSAGTRARLRAALLPYLRGPASEVWREARIGWDRYYGDFGELGSERELTTSLVLKAPGENGEKGVLYSSFEYNWMRLVAHHDARAVLRDYILVGASSWSPPDYAAFAALAGLSRDPAFIGISNVEDVEAYRLMSPAVEPLPLLAGDWVDPDVYQPLPLAEREIDVLMVAHWAPFKRHWLLWKALRELPRTARVVLVGRDLPGRTWRDLRAEARGAGVRQELEFERNVPPERVAELQCAARVSAVFSQREGSCVAVPESLFADAPVAMMRDAHVGSRAYINPRTGVLLDAASIAREFARFHDEAERFDARAWAVENTGCHVASARLNAALRDHALRYGEPWTRDIEPLRWRYVPEYVDPAARERMAPAVRALRERHGVTLREFVPPPARIDRPLAAID
jgi:glycosyltransferase involved in cell wall biosynthesis